MLQHAHMYNILCKPELRQCGRKSSFLDTFLLYTHTHTHTHVHTHTTHTHTHVPVVTIKASKTNKQTNTDNTPISWMGCLTPISLLTAMIDTREVSGVSDASKSCTHGCHKTNIHVHTYIHVTTNTCTVEPLYCGHHWSKKMCPHQRGVLISEVDLYTKVYYWDLRNYPDVLIREVPLYPFSSLLLPLSFLPLPSPPIKQSPP